MGGLLQPKHQDMAAETRTSLLKGVSQPQMCSQHLPGLCNVSPGWVSRRTLPVCKAQLGQGDTALGWGQGWGQDHHTAAAACWN